MLLSRAALGQLGALPLRDEFVRGHVMSFTWAGLTGQLALPASCRDGWIATRSGRDHRDCKKIAEHGQMYTCNRQARPPVSAITCYVHVPYEVFILRDVIP